MIGHYKVKTERSKTYEEAKVMRHTKDTAGVEEEEVIGKEISIWKE